MVAHVEGGGCWAYTVYNHLYHPRAYVKPEDGGLLEEYRFLTEHVSMWDVAVERQIQVKGPDAAAFVDLLITRDVHSSLPTMTARYVILCNQYGGVINDPVLLRVADDEFWFSISDSDVVLWAQGVNANAGYNVEINEIDVAPVQIQGPKSVMLMEKMFGPRVREIPYYHIIHDTLNGHAVTISRTGFSAEVGFEIYLHDAMRHSDDVWPYILEQGEEFNLHVIAPSHIRRLEAGILSYGQDLDLENNPYEVRLGWQVDLNKGNFIGKEALARIKEEGRQAAPCWAEGRGRADHLVQRGLLPGQGHRHRRRRGLHHQRILVTERRVEHRPCRHAPHALEARHSRQGAAPQGRPRRRRGCTGPILRPDQGSPQDGSLRLFGVGGRWDGLPADRSIAFLYRSMTD